MLCSVPSLCQQKKKKNKLKIPTKPAHGQGRTQHTSVLWVRPAMQHRLLSHIPRTPSPSYPPPRVHLAAFIQLTTHNSGLWSSTQGSCMQKLPSRVKSAKITATNRNKQQQKLRQNCCAVAQQLQQQPQSQSQSESASQVRFQFRFQWLNLLLSL